MIDFFCYNNILHVYTQCYSIKTNKIICIQVTDFKKDDHVMEQAIADEIMQEEKCKCVNIIIYYLMYFTLNPIKSQAKYSNKVKSGIFLE